MLIYPFNSKPFRRTPLWVPRLGSVLKSGVGRQIPGCLTFTVKYTRNLRPTIWELGCSVLCWKLWLLNWLHLYPQPLLTLNPINPQPEPYQAQTLNPICPKPYQSQTLSTLNPTLSALDPQTPKALILLSLNSRSPHAQSS